MAYCTDTDLIERFGRADVVSLTDYDADGEPDEESLDNAIDSASNEIDSYLAVLFAVPLAPVPDVVRDCCIALTWCHLMLGRDSLTDKWEKECTKWHKWLEGVASGAIAIPGAPSASAGAPGVDYTADERIFGRSHFL